MWKTIFVTGPTASGKSDLAIYLAKKFNGEIINADSRQVYKYLDIGSGKVSKKEMNGVFHYLLSIAHPKRNYSLGRWLKDADEAVKKIIKKGKVPIFFGGTILYLRAIKEGWILPPVKPNYKLRKELEKKTNEELYKEIKKT
jgi:tRNA dimethylallyltransferase